MLHGSRMLSHWNCSRVSNVNAEHGFILLSLSNSPVQPLTFFSPFSAFSEVRNFFLFVKHEDHDRTLNCANLCLLHNVWARNIQLHAYCMHIYEIDAAKLFSFYFNCERWFFSFSFLFSVFFHFCVLAMCEIKCWGERKSATVSSHSWTV